MKIEKTVTILALFSLFFFGISCKKEKSTKNSSTVSKEIKTDLSKITFDSVLIPSFFKNHPQLQSYQADVELLYRKNDYHYVWFAHNGINEIGDLFYTKINNLAEEGVVSKVPYKNKLDFIFENEKQKIKPNATTDLLISALYFYYTSKVYEGLDAKKVNEIGWYLPNKKRSYVNYLDSITRQPNLMNKENKEVLSQYYRLKEVLKKYRRLEEKGFWNTIVIDSGFTQFKPGDSAQMIGQIRQKLWIMGDLKSNSKSLKYDQELKEGMLNFKKRNGNLLTNTITRKDIAILNVPIADRIKTIMVNMERCRWISNDILKSEEFIVVNIPSYKLTFFRNGNPVFRSNVVVGKTMHKTVIFSANMKYIVFSPYWNIPESIVKNEIKPGIAKNKKYLAQHNMEKVGAIYRQKPGTKNSLGLIKFLFPNSNLIYFHDTPSKSLFKEENKAFSHGCIRLEKPKELAETILKYDKNWNSKKIGAAMNKGKESWYTLKKPIPVYIGYFTAWVNNEGEINFYDDIYSRDETLAKLLYEQ